MGYENIIFYYVQNNIMDDDETHLHRIDVHSGHIGGLSKKLFLYDKYIVIDNNIINIEYIKDIRVSDYNPTDWNVIGILATNVLLGISTSYIFSFTVIESIALIIGFILLGLLATKYLKKNIYSYISIKTESMEYLIGIQNEEDIDKIYNVVSKSISKDISYEDFKKR